MDLKKVIKSIDNYPIEGVCFRDITPVLGNHQAFSHAIDKMADLVKDLDVDLVLGVEARGFIVGCPLALKLGAGFVPVRKPGKLPRQVHQETYDLEYGQETIEVHADALGPGDRVLIVDDLLATGGTASATARMVDKMGAQLLGYCFLIELRDLGGREKLGDYPIHSLVQYD